MAMQGYDRDDYEDLDEYEEDGDEQGEEAIDEGEYEEEEAPQTTQEELEYLELRQQLKESIRKQMKKESGSTLTNSQEKKKKLPYDKYPLPSPWDCLNLEARGNNVDAICSDI